MLNADETPGLRTNLIPAHGVCPNGEQHRQRSDEHNGLASPMLACNLAGAVVNPFIILKPQGQRTLSLTLREETHKRVTEGSIHIHTTENGYMTASCLAVFIKFLRKWVNHDQRLILILDGHRTRYTVEAQAAAQTHNIRLVIFTAKLYTCSPAIGPNHLSPSSSAGYG